MNDTSDPKQVSTLDIKKITELLPHRYPFLLIDRIIDIKGDQSAVGIKNVTANEYYFQGHFPIHPVMPGVLLIEGMAQTAGALCVFNLGDEYDASLVYFMAIDRARFRKPVMPGDTVYYHMEKIRNRGRVWRCKGEAKVDGKIVAGAEISATMVDI